MLHDLFALVQTILQNGRIGTLTLSRRKQSERIFFDRDGAYIFGTKTSRKVAVSPALESIPSFREHLADLLREATTTNRTLPEIIATKGWVLQDRAFEEMSVSQTLEEILSALGECHAYFRFHDLEVPEELLGTVTGRPPTCVPRQDLLVALDARRRESEEIERSIPILDEVFIPAAPLASVPGRGFLAAYIEASTLKLVDGRRTVREIQSASPFFEGIVLRNLVSLMARGAIKKTRLPEIAGIQIHKLTPEKAQEVLPLFRRVVRHAYNEMEIRLALAQILDVAGQREKAVEEYCAIGDEVARDGRCDEALAIFEKAHELAPGAAAVAARIRGACVASAQLAGARKEPAEAEKRLRRAIALCPGDLDLYMRLLACLGPAGDARKLTEIADAAAAHTRTSRDPRLGVTVLEAIARRFPDDPTWRIRRANLLLDLDRKEEAIQEMFAIATALRDKGDARRSAQVLDKLERLADGREDVLRAIRECRRAFPSKRAPVRRRLWAPISASALVLAVIAYQTASYFAYCRVERESGVADAAEVPSTARQADDAVRKAEETILRYQTFRLHWSISLWSITAGGRIAAATERAKKALELRDEIREASVRRAEKLRDLGDLDGARTAFATILQEGFDDLWHERALSALDGILSGEAEAQALAARTKEAEAGGRFEEAFDAARRAIDEFPSSKCVQTLSLPIEVATDPPGARVWVGGIEKGPAPQIIHIRHFQPVELTAVLPGYQPARTAVENPRKYRLMIPLDRAPAWRLDLAGVERPPLASGDSIYAVDATGGIHAIASALGKPRWAFREGAITEVRAGPIRIGGELCIATNDGRIALIDETRGTRMASIPAGGLIASELVPILGGRGVAVATRDGKVRAFELKPTAPLWHTPASPIAPQAIASVAAQVALAVEPSLILFLAEETGGEAWRHDIGGRPIAGPIIANGLVLCASGDGRIHAIDPQTRKAAWSVDASASPGPFRAIGDALWFVDREDRLRSIALADGRVRSEPALPARPRWIAPGPDGSLLVDAGPGRIHAIDPATGRTRWRFSGDGAFGAPPVCQGELVVAASDRALFGIRVPRDADPRPAPRG